MEQYILIQKVTSMELSILYFKGSTGQNFYKMMQIVFILANRADPDEMQLYAAFYLGLHCLHEFSHIQRVKAVISKNK